MRKNVFDMRMICCQWVLLAVLWLLWLTQFVCCKIKGDRV